jgi:hypothetical protein
MMQFHFPINTLTIALFVIFFTLEESIVVHMKLTCGHSINGLRTIECFMLFEGMDKSYILET